MTLVRSEHSKRVDVINVSQLGIVGEHTHVHGNPLGLGWVAEDKPSEFSCILPLY